jgi:hypothetical protein
MLNQSYRTKGRKATCEPWLSVPMSHQAYICGKYLFPMIILFPYHGVLGTKMQQRSYKRSGCTKLARWRGRCD